MEKTKWRPRLEIENVSSFIYIGRIVDDFVYIAYLQSMGLQQLHVKLNEISNEEETEEEGTLR